MDKNAIKKYAVWARRELIEKVSQKALQYGIEEGNDIDSTLVSINGVLLSNVEKEQRQALIRRIKELGYRQVMEEVAYTWFNRFIALRFMEVNGYLPSHVRVFTDEEGRFKPQIMSEALHLDIEGVDIEKVYALKSDNKDDDLFKYLLITQCNALSGILPKMFQKIADYTELLLPDFLLRDGSVIEQMVNGEIPEDDWKDQVQILGWLYQYYNSEPKDAVFAALKKNVKITKENIPAATQLFTPDWVVRYMVDNSLGRLWLQGHPSDSFRSELKYYLDEDEQEIEVQNALEIMLKETKISAPQDIRCIDPCMGSGHILCYMFDLLVKIYEDYGFSARDAVQNIVEKNIWGLDIDDRAAQLAYFAVMMKARQYDRRFFTKQIQPNVFSIDESNGISLSYLEKMGRNLSKEERQLAVEQITRLLSELNDAKEYGSITQVSECDWKLLYRFVSGFNDNEEQLTLDFYLENEIKNRIERLIRLGEALAQTYHITVTNPPYMGNTGMDAKLSAYVKDRYSNGKADMFAVFVQRAEEMTKKGGIYAMITQPSLLFLPSFTELRKSVLVNGNLLNSIHMGRGIFGIDFGSAAICVRNIAGLSSYKAKFVRLHERTFQYIKPEDIEALYLKAINRIYEKYDFSNYDTGIGINNSSAGKGIKLLYSINLNKFMSIPGVPFAYWITDAYLNAFENGMSLGDYCDVKQGMSTADNDRFLRLWHEVDFKKIAFLCESSNEASLSGKKWFPYNKGGNFRKWYGNNEYVINWENDGLELRGFKKAVLRNTEYYFKEALTWSLISSKGKLGIRYSEQGHLFDAGGSSLFSSKNLLYILAFLSSNVAQTMLNIINPTMNFSNGVLSKVPILIDEKYLSRVEQLSKSNVEMAKKIWNWEETSWDFEKPIFLCFKGNDLRTTISNCLEARKSTLSEIGNNEEEIDSIFAEIYNIHQKEEIAITEESDEENNDEADNGDGSVVEIKDFISYAVGCMFGRYSLDNPGIVCAGGNYDENEYVSFVPDEDAIVPICDDEYFSDDIVGRFILFVEIIFGKANLEENLQYIADTLGGNGTSREIIRNYFINDFYNDHIKKYQKRPIYWLFDSGKKNGFKCLIYMHRYQPDTIARIRTDYVHEQQARYRTAIEETEKRIESASGSDKVKLTKKLNTLKAQDDEIHAYEEKIHHLADQMISIDLDDGVKHNYEIFKDVLAKIK